MKLYEVCAELDSIIEHGEVFVSVESGEVFTADALDALKMERDEKVDNCLMVMRQYEADSVAIDTEIKRLTALKKTYQSRAEWLKSYVQGCLKGEKFKSDKFNVTYRNTKSANIVDWTLIPAEFYKDRTDKDISKSKIMEVLKAGGSVPGAELEEKTSMVVK